MACKRFLIENSKKISTKKNKFNDYSSAVNIQLMKRIIFVFHVDDALYFILENYVIFRAFS